MKTLVDLGVLLADAAQGGAYFVDLRDRAALIETGNALGFAVVPVECIGLRGQAAVLEAFAQALRVPDWFGDDWPALADALVDLSWWPAKGYLLLLDNAERWREEDPADVACVLDIANATAAHWARAGIPFWMAIPLSARALATVDAAD